MSRLIAILSPSKKMAIPAELPTLPYSQPTLQSQTEFLLRHVTKWDEVEIAKRMGVSASIAHETCAMHKAIRYPMQLPAATPAILAFSGDVYRGLDAKTLTEKQLITADTHIRILSGLYGYLKPLQLIQPYRLMMGTPISLTQGHTSLPSYWREHISQAINDETKERDVLINLASLEYSTVLDEKAISIKIIRCDFRELKNGKAVSVSTYAKVARGLMARYILQQVPKTISELKKFNLAGYRFNEDISDEKTLLFTR